MGLNGKDEGGGMKDEKYALIPAYFFGINHG